MRGSTRTTPLPRLSLEPSSRVHHAVGVRSGGIAADPESAGDLPGTGIEPDHLLPNVLNHPHGVVPSRHIPRHPREVSDPGDLSRTEAKMRTNV